MGVKTNIELVSFVKQCIGDPYWYGTFGQIATDSLYRYNKSRLPAYYTAMDFKSQYGKHVNDCIGLVKRALWSDNPSSIPVYTPSQDYSADGMLQACEVSGVISTLQEIHGALVFMKGHVGIYIGNGEVVEARGHAYGTVQTKLKSRPWTHWGLCPLIEYKDVETSDSTSNYQITTIQKWLNFNYNTGLIVDGEYGQKTHISHIKAYQTYLNNTYGANLAVDGIYGAKSKSVGKNIRFREQGNHIYIIQGLLYCKGYNPKGFDGVFGNGMLACVKQYQKDVGLIVDGVIGVNTLSKLFD